MSLHLVGFSLAQSFHSIGLSTTLQVQSLAQSLPAYLLRLGAAAFPAAVVPIRHSLPDAVLRQIDDYVASQLDAELSLPRLAEFAHLSPSHFARRFKESTGQTVHEYVLRRRLQRCYEALLATDLPIGCIANDAGFADESHFVRRFKAFFGLTPGALRKRSH